MILVLNFKFLVKISKKIKMKTFSGQQTKYFFPVELGEHKIKISNLQPPKKKEKKKEVILVKETRQ